MFIMFCVGVFVCVVVAVLNNSGGAGTKGFIDNVNSFIEAGDIEGASKCFEDALEKEALRCFKWVEGIAT